MKRLHLFLFLLSFVICQLSTIAIAQTRNRVGVNVTCTMYGNTLAMWDGIEKNTGAATWAQVFRTDTVRFDTGTSLRIEVRKNDTIGASGLVRSEIRDTSYLKNEKWFGLSIYTPASYQPDPDWDIITQWHGYDEAEGISRNPPISLRTINGHWQLVFYWDTAATSVTNVYTGSQTYLMDTILLNRWYDFVYHIKFSYANDGLIEIWRNGVIWFRRQGPNCFNDSRYPYFKFGIYKPGWNFQSDLSTRTSRVLFYDEVRTGTAVTGAQYYSVSPFTLPDKYYPVKWIIKKQ